MRTCGMCDIYVAGAYCLNGENRVCATAFQSNGSERRFFRPRRETEAGSASGTAKHLTPEDIRKALAKDVAYAISKGLRYPELLCMPITAYRLLIAAWRTLDNERYQQLAMASFIAQAGDGKQLKESMDVLWP